MIDTDPLFALPIQSVLDAIPDAAIMTSLTGTIAFMNSTAIRLSENLTRLELGSNIFETYSMFHVPDTLPISTFFPEQDSIINIPNGFPFKNGKGKNRIISIDRKDLFDSDMKKIGYLWLIKEISELVRIRNELQKNQALESIGFLAAGVAHDFNNLLSCIFGFIELAYKSIDSPLECAVHLEDARNIAPRTRDLTKQLQTLSKGGFFQKKVTSIAKLLEESFTICTMGAPLKKKLSIQSTLWNCDVDQGQISQVLNNILINAIQAMPAGGTLIVSASNIELKGNEITTLAAGKYVRIAIRDTGNGISNEIIDHIFDPYFTTKEKGNGLGLAITWSIIKKHQGHIDVESTPEHGSIFTLHLPASFAPIETVFRDDSNVTCQSTSLRVIVMDDNPTLRHIFDKILSKLDCEITTTVSGEHVLQILREAKKNHIHYDTAILDLNITGGKGGKEIVADVKYIFPDIKAIAMSGNTADPIFENPEAFGFHHCLKKPFLIDDLSRLLNEIETNSR